MISLLSAIPVGNAVGILLSPPATAVKWRVVRNTTGDFVDQDDQILIYEGSDKFFIDSAGLENGVLVHYRVYCLTGNAWIGFPAKSIAPGVSFVDRSADPQSLVRDRLDLGLNALIASGAITHPYGIFPVLIASPQFEDAQFPIVTVHLSSASSDIRGIGEIMGFDDDDDDIDGWFDSVALDVVVWSLNGDERKALRKAVRSLLVANLPVFHEAGLANIDLQFSDHDDFETYAAPMYTANGLFRCVAPVSISGATGSAITDVVTTARV
jgi:hypothetical protein